MDGDNNPLPGVEKTVPSTQTRHYVLPTSALAKGNPISVGMEGGKTEVKSVQWAYDRLPATSCDSVRLKAGELVLAFERLSRPFAFVDEASRGS